jgi:hypothetical protein
MGHEELVRRYKIMSMAIARHESEKQDKLHAAVGINKAHASVVNALQALNNTVIDDGGEAADRAAEEAYDAECQQ